ncbi:MAG: glycosyltransferase, partial [Thermomicrobiales bacterium]
MNTGPILQTSHSRTEMNPPALSIVIPVFNEATRIPDSFAQVQAFLESNSIFAEIILVDDGSTDDTANVISGFDRSFANTTALTLPHTGKAGAVLAGLQMAQGSVVGFVDADMATPLETWLECSKRIELGAGVAIATREGTGAIRVGEPWYRHVMGRAFNGLVRLLLLPGIHDTQCGFKFFTREAIDVILPRCQLYRNASAVTVARVTAFDVELL